MSYIIGLIAVIVFFAALHHFTELDHKQKSAVTLVVALLIGGMYAYNVMTDNEREHTNAVILKYNQGKSVRCEGVDINQSTFDLSTGTQTFIGREGTEHYARMFSAGRCE